MNANKLLIPAFLIAIVFILGALWRVGILDNLGAKKISTGDELFELTKDIDFELTSPTSEDYTRGNPKASVKVIEYIDTDCDHCADMQRNLEAILSNRIIAGEVSWTIRHFITNTETSNESLALECIGQNGGSSKFWDAIDFLFLKTKTSDAEILSWVTENNINRAEFANCIKDNKTKEAILEDLESGIKAGVIGTPYIFIINPEGKIEQVVGLHPRIVIESMINRSLGLE